MISDVTTVSVEQPYRRRAAIPSTPRVLHLPDGNVPVTVGE